MSRNLGNDDAVELVRSRTDIVSVISEYVKLRKAGRNYVGLCPFHEEKTGSFTVDGEKQLFYCFGCGEGGNVFTFVMKREGLSFPEALERLAAKAGVELPRSRGRSGQSSRKQEHKGVLDALVFAQGRYREALQGDKGAGARDYLKQRGISPEIVEKFGLGYAPAEWDFVAAGAKRSKFDLGDFQKAGLLMERPRSEGYYDRFRNRIIFPIWDGGGVLIGFGGRAMGDDTPKYLNSPQTPVFHKGSVLYGLNLAKPTIRRTGKVCVVEGYMDVIAGHQYGVDYMVGGMGTALGKDQARTLVMLAQDVYLVYDRDEAGKRATRGAIDAVREAGGKSFVVTIPGAKDPDDFLRAKGTASFQERLRIASPDVQYVYDEARRDFDDMGVEGKVRVKDAIVPVLGSLVDGFERQAYIEEFSRDMGVPKESLVRDVERYRRTAVTTPKHKESENRDTTGYENHNVSLPAKRRDEVSSVGGISGVRGEVGMVRKKAEEGLIRSIIEDRTLLGAAREGIGEKGFQVPECRAAFEALAAGPMESLTDDRMLGYLAGLCIRFGPVGDPRRVVSDCLGKFEEEELERLREVIARAERNRDEEGLRVATDEYSRLLRQAKSSQGRGRDSFGGSDPRREWF